MIDNCFFEGEKPHPCPVCFKPFRMRSDMKRHMQMHARDGSDVSLLLACAEQGIDPLEAISADPDALAALREKTAMDNVKRGERSRRVVMSKVRIYSLPNFYLGCQFRLLRHLMKKKTFEQMNDNNFKMICYFLSCSRARVKRPPQWPQFRRMMMTKVP